MYSPFVSHRSFAPSIFTAVCNGVILEWRGRRGGGEGCGKQREHPVGDLGRRRKGVWEVSSPAPAPPHFFYSSLLSSSETDLLSLTQRISPRMIHISQYLFPNHPSWRDLSSEGDEPGLWPSLRWNSI